MTAVLAVSLAVAAGAAVFLYRPPWPQGADAPPDRFSAARAMAHVEALARSPRPFGSPAHGAAKAYIRAQLRAIGREPFELETLPRAFGPAGPPIDNIAVRIPGAAEGDDAVLFAAHVDSRPGSPGAGDNAAGVAVLLETLRAVQAGPAPRNDLIFLFTDAEEEGLLGAKAFLEGANAAGHPWKDEVRAVVNIDGRGTAGLAIVSGAAQNGLAPHLAGIPNAVASSFLDAFRGGMPYRSDGDAFREAGLPVLDIAFLDGFARYHSPLDTPRSLHTGTLQHLGDGALNLARSLGAADTASFAGAGRAYFNPAPRLFVHYPGWFRWPLLLVCLAAYGGVLYAALRNGHASGLGVLCGALAAIVALGLCAVAAYGLSSGFRIALGERAGWTPHEVFAVQCAAAIGLYASALALARFWLRAQELALGALGLWTVAAFAVTLLLPGAAPVATWPLLAALAALAYHLVSDDYEQAGTGTTLLAAAAGAFALLLFIPLLLTLHLAAAPLDPFTASLPSLAAAFAATLLALPLCILIDAKPWAIPAAGLALANVFALAGLSLAEPRAAAALRDGEAWRTETATRAPAEGDPAPLAAEIAARMAQAPGYASLEPVYALPPGEAVAALSEAAAGAPPDIFGPLQAEAVRIAAESGIPELAAEARRLAEVLAERFRPYTAAENAETGLLILGRAAADHLLEGADTPDARNDAHLRAAQYALALGDFAEARTLLDPAEGPVMSAWAALAHALTSVNPAASRDALLVQAAALPEPEAAALTRALERLIPVPEPGAGNS